MCHSLTHLLGLPNFAARFSSVFAPFGAAEPVKNMSPPKPETDSAPSVSVFYEVCSFLLRSSRYAIPPVVRKNTITVAVPESPIPVGITPVRSFM